MYLVYYYPEQKLLYNLDNLINTDYEQLYTIPDIGQVIAKSIEEYFKNSENMDVINKLKQYNINMSYIGKQKNLNDLFINKIFVLTGTLETLTRDEAKDLIESLGGKVTSSVSKSTDVVVVGTSPGSKYEKAKQLNIEIFINMISS